MNVSGVCRPSEEMYTYNSIRLNTLRRDHIEADAGTNAKADIAKALADAAKDFSLQQYQYFVRTNASDVADVVFRSGKKFAL